MKPLRTNNPPTVKVWDLLIRIFHWSLAISFVVAFVTEDDFLYLHSFAGYCILGLLAFRLCWGVIGTRHARFSDFVTGPAAIKRYLKSLLTRHPEPHLGHNPAGGAVIVIMLALLALTAFTGMATLATEGLGPLADTFVAGFSEDWLEEIHEQLANLMLLLVIVHLGGVLVSSLLHRENLVRAMINGRKRQPIHPEHDA